MKYLLLFLFLVSPSMAQKFGDDNESGVWLQVPDDYVWPDAVNGALDFKTKLKKFSELTEVQREGIKRLWPEGAEPVQVNITEIDLNTDGKLEIFVGIPAYSGTGGIFYGILSLADGKYKSIGGLQGWGLQFMETKNGWFQIQAMSRGGGGNYTRYLMAFTDSGYKTVRNEGHDFNLGKVTIRKPQKQ